jgi:hypothetical protein
MCTYCMIGDNYFRYNPPSQIPWQPLLPQPALPPRPWSLQEFQEFKDLLERVKALEDRLGCPCEPNKIDYLKIIREAIERLEAAAT